MEPGRASEEVFAFVQRCQAAVGEETDGCVVGILANLWTWLRSTPRCRTQLDRIAMSSAALRLAWGARRRLPTAAAIEPATARYMPRRARVSAAIDVLTTLRADPDVDLQKVAHLVSVSDTHLCRALHAETGWGFSIHLHGLRILDAIVMLRTTRLAIKVLAQLIGYRRTGDMDRQFVSWLGVTPRAFRESSIIRFDCETAQVRHVLECWTAHGEWSPGAVADNLAIDFGLVVSLRTAQRSVETPKDPGALPGSFGRTSVVR